jgi:hypothetical protein
VRRIVQYRLRDQAALDSYLREQAPQLRQQGQERFGDRFHAERRVLRHREEFVRGAVSTENCLNCGEVLTGQHCSHCGQRASVRVISLWGMLKDVTGDMLDWIHASGARCDRSRSSPAGSRSSSCSAGASRSRRLSGCT